MYWRFDIRYKIGTRGDGLFRDGKEGQMSRDDRVPRSNRGLEIWMHNAIHSF